MKEPNLDRWFFRIIFWNLALAFAISMVVYCLLRPQEKPRCSHEEGLWGGKSNEYSLGVYRGDQSTRR